MPLSESWFAILVLVSLCIQPASLERLCHRGYYLYTPSSGSDDCLQCTLGQFMPEDQHSNRLCYPCSVLQHPQWEIYVSPCNATHDTEIHCQNGYYRTRPSYPGVRGQCQKCTECVSTLHPCQMFNDSVCCPQNDYGVYTDKTGRPECIRECGPGQFSDAAEGNCLTCPPGTYMDENRHINSHCKECQKCSQNRDGNIYEGRTCTKLRDTVCCPKPNMTVMDAHDGPVCNVISTLFSVAGQTIGTPHLHVCGEGEYLFTNVRTHSSTCQPCPQGTYMDEIEHTRGSCKSCQEFPHVKCSAQVTADHKSCDDDALTAGETAGLVVGVVVMIVIVVVVVLCVWWRRRKRRVKKVNTGVPGDERFPLKGADDSSAESGDVPEQNYTIPTGFIAPKDFSANHLPAKYSDENMVGLIKLQARLTVLLHLASHRFSDDNIKKTLTLSGWVERVKTYKDQSCPCMTCQKSAVPVTSWVEFVICTAASIVADTGERVVIDITEGKNIQCYFFYSNDAHLKSCQSVSGALKVLSDAEKDWCFMTFVTHEEKLTEKLPKIYAEYHGLRSKIKKKYDLVAENVKEGRNVQTLCSEYETLVNRLKNLSLGVMLGHITEGSKTILVALEPALGITDGGTREQEMLKIIMSKLLESYKRSHESLTEWNHDPTDETPSQEQYLFLYHKANELDKYLGHLESELPNTDATNHPYNPRYNPLHPFTVVVSHPRGGPKKISLGEVTDRKTGWFDLGSTYKYTNMTDRGSGDKVV